MKRPGWDQYFLKFAEVSALRATCDRKYVGAVIVVDRRIVATGYNGSIIGMPHCSEVGHDLVNNHCVRTIHAEVNALTQAAQKGVSVQGSAIYTTASPCWNCFRVLVNSGIVKFVYAEEYRHGENQAKIDNVVEKLGLEFYGPDSLDTR